MPSEHQAEEDSFDWWQFIVLGVSLTTALLALGELESGKISATIIVLAVIAVVAMVLFIRIAGKSTKKLLNLSVFKSKGWSLRC